MLIRNPRTGKVHDKANCGALAVIDESTWPRLRSYPSTGPDACTNCLNGANHRLMRP